jgi:CheY-like chemotaxis protein
MKKLLLVEDREDDIVLLKLALKQSGYPHTLDVVSDGEAAIHYLAHVQSTAYSKDSEVPDLVLLDLKLPKVDGHEVLTWIRQQLQFAALPVIVLTSSNRRDDILRAFSLGANSYIIKSGDLPKLNDSARTILKYWLEVNHTVPLK